jgi:nicotinamide mononucleotide transporter
MISVWLQDNYIEVFGALTGILYVFLEIRQKIWLWPVGIITSAVYIWVFFTGKLYADMSLQVYYLIISCLGWYWWAMGRNGKSGDREKEDLPVTRLKLRTGIILALVFLLLYVVLHELLDWFTDSPVPGWDSFITSLSIIATWMLARKIYEHWYLWIVVNSVATVLFLTRGLYPTVVLYFVYGLMSFAGLAAWRKTLIPESNKIKNE